MPTIAPSIPKSDNCVRCFVVEIPPAIIILAVVRARIDLIKSKLGCVNVPSLVVSVNINWSKCRCDMSTNISVAFLSLDSIHPLVTAKPFLSKSILIIILSLPYSLINSMVHDG